jgi:MATE family multidrug resistance protein
MAQVNPDILIRSALLLAAFTSFMFLAADFGDVSLAATQVLIQFVYVTSHAMDGFAFAAEALVGRAMGGRSRLRLIRAALVASVWGGAVGLSMALGIAVFGGAIVDLMTVSDPVRAAARADLGWLVAAPLLGWASYMLDGIFIGATRTRDMRNMMAVSFAGYLMLVAILVPPWGSDGLWAALMGFFVLRGVTLGLRYPSLERTAR